MPPIKAAPVAATVTAEPMPLGMKHLTHDQRQAMRGLLDANFDDKEGCYLEGYSDAKIAAEVGVHVSLVRATREAGWGPIRITPEMMALSRDIALAKGACADQRKAVGDLELRISELEARLDKAVKSAAA